MPTLCVLRHAKSGWDQAVDDHERRLAPRGREAAPRVGAWLRAQGRLPDLVLCSSARRTQETLRALGDLGDPVVDVSPAYYLVTANQWLTRLRTVADGTPVVLLVGHNPGLQELALDLATGGPGKAALRQGFPTAALAVLEFTGGWGDLAPGGARLAAFVRPRDLG